MQATAQKITEILSATLVGGGKNVTMDGVFTDSRAVLSGGLFIALSGENFDGNQFAAGALEAGANIAIVSKWSGEEISKGKAVIQVEDSLLSLQKLAYWWRSQLDIPIICITGSNGKTSTKDLTRSVLSQKFNVHATHGNLNNHIGLPLTVLSTTKEHTAAIYEIGMNHAGELSPLCEISRPKFGVITNIGTAHIEFLGSREAIAEEKGTLARYLPSDGLLFTPAGCEYNEYFRGRTSAQLIPVGNGRGMVRAENLHAQENGTTIDLVIDGEESIEAFIPVVGRHMVTNALLAAAIGWKLGLSPTEIVRGLSSVNLTSGRLRRLVSGSKILLDDTYNANPESMEAAIQTLSEMAFAGKKRPVAVLGEMGELGPFADDEHRKIGKLAADQNLVLLTVGDGAKLIAEAARSRHFDDVATASEWLRENSTDHDIILFKGSRSAAVERVLHQAFPDAC